MQQQIIELLHRGENDKALKLCTDLYSKNKNSSDLCHLLGLMNAQNNNLEIALEYFQQAINLDPNQAEYHNNMACALRKNGKYEIAERHFRHALNLKSNFYEAYNNYASLLYKQGKIDDSILYLEKSLRLNPEYAEAHFNLANCYVLKNKLESAITHFIKNIQYSSKTTDNSNAEQNLAMCYIATNQLEKALPLLEKVIINNTKNHNLNRELAKTYLDLGRSSEAIIYFKKSIILDPTEASQYHNLAILYLREKDDLNAKKYFKKALELNPNNQIAKHMLNSLDGKTPKTSPKEHVEKLFNQYAEHYDKHTKNKLSYKVPELLRNHFAPYIKSNEKSKNILDLGCGTGQCGIYFRDLANIMIGVDVAKNMLLQAKNLDAYNYLCQADLNKYIPGLKKNFFDMIIAADVLVYLGDLDNLFYNCQQTLTNNGYFLFTIETLFSNNMNNYATDYKLLATGRFAHTILYLENLSQKYDFNILKNSGIIPRKNDGKDVMGNLFILQKK